MKTTIESYSERLERECAEMDKIFPNVKKVIDEVIRINNMPNVEFDYNIERTHMMYTHIVKYIKTGLL